MRAATIFLVAMCLPGFLSGCADIAPPNWFHPGPAEYQRAQAQRTDPYPEPDTGPEVVGARPREFQVPSAEPTRVQTEYSWSKRYGPPPPGLFRSSGTWPRTAPPVSYAAAPVYGQPVYPTAQAYSPPTAAPQAIAPPSPYGGQAVRSAGPDGTIATPR